MDTEYEACLNSYEDHSLNFGTWKTTIIDGHFEKRTIDEFTQYQNEMHPIWDEYYTGLHIEKK